MKSVKTLLHGLFAAIALSTVAGPANACIPTPEGIRCGMLMGLNAQQNAGLFVPPFLGLNAQQNAGLFVPPFLGLNAQQNAGLFAPPFLGLNAQQNAGLFAPPFLGLNAAQNAGLFVPPFLGLNAAQNAGFPGSNFGPFSWGINPIYSWGMNPQQNAGFLAPPFFGLSPAQNAGFFFDPLMGLGGQQSARPQIYPVMVPYPVPAQQTGPAVQPVQCSINQVPALTKSVDDCEKAGGDVPAATKTSALQEASK